MPTPLQHLHEGVGDALWRSVGSLRGPEASPSSSHAYGARTEMARTRLLRELLT